MTIVAKAIAADAAREPAGAQTTPAPPALEPPRGRLVLGVFARWASMGVSIILGLVVTPIIIRTLGKEAYGLWGLAATFVGFYGLFDFGLSSAISRFLGLALGARDVEQLNRVASTGRLLLTVLSVLVIIFAVAIMGPAQSILRIPAEYTHEFRWLLLISGVAVAITLNSALYLAGLVAGEDFSFLSVCGIGTAALRSAGALFAVISGYGVLGLAVANAAAGVAELCALHVRCRQRLPYMKAMLTGCDPGTVLTLLPFGAAAFVVDLALVARMKLDSALAMRFCGLGQAGLYAVATSLFLYFGRATVNASGVIWPRMNSLAGARDALAFRDFFVRASRLVAALATSLSLVAQGLAVSGVVLLLGRQYLASAFILQIRIAGYVTYAATTPGVGALYAHGRHKYYAVQSVCEAAACVVLATFLGPRYGVYGIAISMAAPLVVVRSTIQPWYVARLLGIRLCGYWMRSVARPLVLEAIFVGVLVVGGRTGGVTHIAWLAAVTGCACALPDFVVLIGSLRLRSRMADLCGRVRGARGSQRAAACYAARRDTST